MGEFPHGKCGWLTATESRYTITSFVYAVFLCDHTTGCDAYTLLRQRDMGSLRCAHILVRVVHMKVRHKQVCTRLDSEGQGKKLPLTQTQGLRM